MVVAILLAVLAGSAVACMSGESTEASFETWDSAGIEITKSFKPQWEDDEGWRVASEPRLDIGQLDGEDDYLLGRVEGSTVTDRGSVMVANGMDCTIRLFDEWGKLVNTAGGCGQGPEEFERILGLFRVGSEVFVQQYPQAFLKVFSDEGDFLHSLLPDESAGLPLGQIYGVFQDGAPLLLEMESMRGKTGVHLHRCTLVKVDTGGQVDSLVVLPYSNWNPHPSGFSDPVRPGYSLSVAVQGDLIYHGWPETYEVGVTSSSGTLLRKIQREWAPIQVEEGFRQAEVQRMLKGEGEGGVGGPPSFRKEIADGMVFSSHHPAFQGILLDPARHLWVQRTDPDRPGHLSGITANPDRPSEWDVFDPEGLWLGMVQAPPGLLVQEIGEDYLVGVFRDELEVEHVRVYDLRRARR